jgi:4-hydroxy-tetrahydrodipicolinate synthase
MLAALEEGDPGAAMRIWEKVSRFEELRAAHRSAGNVSVVKEALAQLGLCRPDVRPPISRLTADERAEVRDVLVSWGLAS